ncbi:MAG: FAD-binding oxidoreductase, partial [Acidobacteriota bacterium]
MTTRKQGLRLLEKRRETEDAVSLVFEQPTEPYRYRPGQFLTLELTIAGRVVRRAYSLSSCPTRDEHLAVTVQRIPGGLVSNHLHDELAVGDEVMVLPPVGRFCIDVDPERYRTYYLFGAGSGITPLMSILETVLHSEPDGHVRLLYGNRNEDRVIFRDRLAELCSLHPERLTVVHSLSRPLRDTWSSLWRWGDVDQEARQGRIDEETLRWFFREHPPVSQDAQYFTCGPGAMIETVTDALRRLGVPDE